MEEIWKNIPNYEGQYQASNLGRIRSLKFNRILVLKPSINQNGYYILNLNNKSCRVHRLIGITFLENPNNLYCLNHKDGNKLNNCVSNLEWCSSSHNNYEAYRLGLRKGWLSGKFGKNYPRKVNVIAKCDDNGNILEIFYGTGEIKRKYGYCPISILDTCKGKYKKMYGYKWRFIDE